MQRHPALLALLPVALLPLLAAAPARAARLAIVYASSSADPTGVTVSASGASAPCAAPCPVLTLTRGGASAPRAVRTTYATPRGLLTAGGAVRLRYRTPDRSAEVRVLGRYGGRWLRLRALRSPTRAEAVVALRAGADRVAVEIGASGATTAADTASPVEVRLIVVDAEPPAVAWAGDGLGDDVWRRGGVCGRFDASDAGLGVDRVELVIGGATARSSAPSGTRLQPRPAVFAGEVCVDTAGLQDGVYGSLLTAVDAGEDGNRSAPVTGVVRVDNTAPTVTWTPPADPALRQPVSVLRVVDGASGVSEVTATIDGLPADVQGDGSEFAVTPLQALADGAHALAWRAVDAAGNAASGTEALVVVDADAPGVGAIAPVGSCSASCTVSAAATDVGSGVDPASWRLAVDGVDVSGAASVVGDAIALRRLWTPGAHRVRVSVADRSGNIAVRSWRFAVPIPDAPAGGLHLRARSARVPVGGVVRLSGAVPGTRSVRIAIEVRAGASWLRVAIVRPGPGGRFAVALRAPVAGAYVLRARCRDARSAPVVVTAA